jgi:membrane protein required for colicin V production
LIIGIIASMKLALVLMNRFVPNPKSEWLPYVFYIIIFVAIYVIVFFLGKYIEKLLKLVNLNLFNRIAGLVFGTFKGIFLFSLIIWLSQQASFLPDTYKEKSFFYKYFKDIAPAIIDVFSSLVPVFRDVISQVEDFFDKIVSATK